MSAAGDFEACAEVVPEFDAVLAAGLQEAEKAVAAIAAGVAAGSAADLALGDLATNVVLGAVGVQWDLGPFEHHQQFALVGALAGQQTIERGEAGSCGRRYGRTAPIRPPCAPARDGG